MNENQLNALDNQIREMQLRVRNLEKQVSRLTRYINKLRLGKKTHGDLPCVAPIVDVTREDLLDLGFTEETKNGNE